MASDATNEQPCPVANNMDSEEFVQALAEMEKEVANEHYSMKLYKAALAGYDRAIELWPTCARYYANRAACYMMLGQYRNALSDAKRCIEIDPKLLRAYTRVIKCCLILGDIIEAEFTLNKLLEIDPENKSVAAEKKDLEYVQKYIAEAEAAYAAKDYRKVVYCMDRCCSVSTHCTRFKLSKAECLAFLGRYPEALEIANSNLHIDKQNADALFVRGMCLYYQDNVEDAFAHVQQVLRLAPDHTKALEIYKRAKNLMKKKQEGNAAFKMEEYQKAHRLYTEALAIDPHNFVINAKLHCNKAMAAAKLGNWDESVQECTEALKLDENYLKALLRRAASYIELKQYEEAVRDLEKAYKMNKSRDLKRQLFEAKLALKKSKRKDYYKILGIDQNASTDDIKKAYRKRAMVHHPDRHANATEGEKKEQEKKFKEVGEAYGVLSDPKKRLRYDNEHDIDDGETDNGFQDAASFFFDQQQNVVFHPDGGHTFYFF